MVFCVGVVLNRPTQIVTSGFAGNDVKAVASAGPFIQFRMGSASSFPVALAMGVPYPAVSSLVSGAAADAASGSGSRAPAAGGTDDGAAGALTDPGCAMSGHSSAH